MPFYSYICPQEHITQKLFTIEQRKDAVKCEECGKKAKQLIGARTSPPGAWGANPIYSDAMAVHPSQTAEAYEHSVRIGVPTTFTPDGRAVFTSRRHRRDYCRHFGVYDRDGGYGDP